VQTAKIAAHRGYGVGAAAGQELKQWLFLTPLYHVKNDSFQQRGEI